MKIAAWNVNSVRTRLERLVDWLEREQPDALCLQELKVTDDKFPHEAINAVGYHAATHGQKTYNGVAILAKQEPQDVANGFDDGEDEPHARLIAATVNDVRVLSAYFVNGKSVGTDHYEMKLAWIRRLIDHIKRTYDPAEKLALCGDFNIAPTPGDIHDPEAWEGSVLCNDAMRAYFAELVDWGFVDTFRLHQDEPGHFSWWDYRMLAFPKNKGLRIDFVMATPPLAEMCTAAGIDRDQRRPKGGPEGTKPSDHAPVWAEFAVSD